MLPLLWPLLVRPSGQTDEKARHSSSEVRRPTSIDRGQRSARDGRDLARPLEFPRSLGFITLKNGIVVSRSFIVQDRDVESRQSGQIGSSVRWCAAIVS